MFQKIPWFSIGSVDAFERNLEAAQHEVGSDSGDYVSVFYRDEAEMYTNFKHVLLKFEYEK